MTESESDQLMDVADEMIQCVDQTPITQPEVLIEDLSNSNDESITAREKLQTFERDSS